ncbi:hypothetical protein KC963_03680 [Candidatus Saccharibacteria bacterium]|nr:hypothetical protein [Candidatus Saccharibacteria bacterium]
MTEQQTPKSIEKQLVGKRVTVRSFDWKSQLTGELVKVEKYFYVLRLDNGGVIGILKHSAGGIAPVADKTE